MADLDLTARVFWIDGEGADRAVGFAASDEPEDGYVLFQAEAGTGPEALYLEVSDEIFAAEGAVERVVFGAAGFDLTIRAAMASRFGMVQSVAVRLPADAEGGAEAIAALRALLPATLIG